MKVSLNLSEHIHVSQFSHGFFKMYFASLVNLYGGVSINVNIFFFHTFGRNMQLLLPLTSS